MTEPNHSQLTGGRCTYALRLSTGAYVYDPTRNDSSGFDLNTAHVWFSIERAIEVACKTLWIGASAMAVRARP